MRDGVHPNDSGDVKMANVWYPAILKAFEAAKGDAVSVLEGEVKKAVEFKG